MRRDDEQSLRRAAKLAIQPVGYDDPARQVGGSLGMPSASDAQRKGTKVAVADRGSPSGTTGTQARGRLARPVTLAKRCRIALYSHDTVGLGHLRRNLLIAKTLSSPPLNAQVLIIAGSTEANVFSKPRGVDCITLPALRKEAYGYESRSLDI